MKTVNMRGDIISNDYKWLYDYLEWDSTCPNDIRDAISMLEPGEELEVLINSGGGDVQAGQEMYSLLKSVNATAKIQSFAASAAGVAAMGCNKVLMSDVGTLMIHNVSCGGVSGDCNAMEKARDMLKSLNEIMANAYVAKSGMELEKVLKLMNRETWLSAKGAIEYGFADGMIYERQNKTNSEIVLTNHVAVPVQFNNNTAYGLRLTPEIIQKVMDEKAKNEASEKIKNELLGDLDIYGI